MSMHQFILLVARSPNMSHVMYHLPPRHHERPTQTSKSDEIILAVCTAAGARVVGLALIDETLVIVRRAIARAQVAPALAAVARRIGVEIARFGANGGIQFERRLAVRCAARADAEPRTLPQKTLVVVRRAFACPHLGLARLAVL